MINLNISIDNDITYLLEQIGHNCKIENVESRAIINNSDLERTFDDKRIISDTVIKRGNYIEYNNLNFIVLNEINDKRYNSYNKAIMRNCNYNVKFIIDEKLFLFHTFIESEKVLTDSKELIKTVADKIIVTLPATKSTALIKLDDRFISMKSVWQIKGIDRTRKGLINLHCESSLKNNNIDDMVNEIADRYKDSIDRLKGNITAIKPFDIQPDLPKDPTEPEPTDPEIPVDPEPEVPEGLIISGLERFTIWDEDIVYTVNTDKPVIWSLDRTDYIKIDSQTENKCYISSYSTSKIGKTTLKVELVEDSTQFAELLISKFYQ